MLKNVPPGIASRVEIIPKKESRLQTFKARLKSAFWRMPLVEAAREKRRKTAMGRISRVASEAELFITWGGEEVPADLKKSLMSLTRYEKKVLWEQVTLLGDKVFGEWATTVLEKNRELVFACDEASGRFSVKTHKYQRENLEETRALGFETKRKIDRLLAVHQTMWPKSSKDLGHKRFQVVVDVGTKLNFISVGAPGAQGYLSSSE